MAMSVNTPLMRVRAVINTSPSHATPLPRAFAHYASHDTRPRYAISVTP